MADSENTQTGLIQRFRWVVDRAGPWLVLVTTIGLLAGAAAPLVDTWLIHTEYVGEETVSDLKHEGEYLYAPRQGAVVHIPERYYVVTQEDHTVTVTKEQWLHLRAGDTVPVYERVGKLFHYGFTSVRPVAEDDNSG